MQAYALASSTQSAWPDPRREPELIQAAPPTKTTKQKTKIQEEEAGHNPSRRPGLTTQKAWLDPISGPELIQAAAHKRTHEKQNKERKMRGGRGLMPADTLA